MQDTVRWRSDQLDGAVVGSFLGTPWSNESDANPPEGDNPRNLLFSSQIGSRSIRVAICRDAVMFSNPGGQAVMWWA